MDSKAIFVRTSTGEAEISGKTANLYSAIKRVLLMVDGVSTCGEINKRAAPSLRASLDEMFQELEKGGYINDKVKATNIPKTGNLPKMAVPIKMAVPQKSAPSISNPQPISNPEQASGGELDFMSEVTDSAKAKKFKIEQVKIAEQEISRAKLKAQQEAQAIVNKAEQEAAKIREEAERVRQQAAAEISAREEQLRRAKADAEAARVKAEQEAAQKADHIRARLEAAKQKVVQEAKARLEEATKAQQQAETARMMAAHEAAKAQQAAERVVRQEQEIAQQEAHAREAVERLARQKSSEVKSVQPTQPEPMDKTTGDKSAGGKSSPGSKATPIKLDPFFVLDEIKIQIPTPELPTRKVSVVEVEPEIKLDALHFEEPRQSAEQQKPLSASPSETAEQVKQAQEQRISAEQQVKKLADAQAKAWAEAEQRAAQSAQSSTPSSAQLSVPKIVPRSDKPVATPTRATVTRAPRKPFPWGKILFFILVLLLAALFIVPYVLPMRSYIPGVERVLSEKLQQPVHIGQLSGRILPVPRLELGEVYIGSARQLQVKRAQINFSLLGLFYESRQINQIKLEGVKIAGSGLQAVSAWLQQIAADKQYPVQRMVMSGGALDADAIQLTGIEGELIFSQAGALAEANFRADGGKIVLDIIASPEHKPQLALRIYTRALPLLPSWSFDELTVRGELSSTGLRISELDGRMLGGILQGSADIDWRSGWRAQGTLAVKAFTMQNMSQGLSGDMDGSARFQMQAASLSMLADTATLDGAFIVSKGVINGIDIVETARSRSKESGHGGRTHFDELSGILSVTKDNYAFRQLKMNAGELIVTGTLDVTRQQLSGTISADMTRWPGMGKVTLRVGGTTDNPSLRGAP